MRKTNHTLADFSVAYTTKAGSRTRVRIPTAGTHTSSLQPGDKVFVRIDRKKVNVSRLDPKFYKRNAYGHYTVDKDGAIRIPAYRFGLNPKKVNIKCDALNFQVVMS